MCRSNILYDLQYRSSNFPPGTNETARKLVNNTLRRRHHKKSPNFIGQIQAISPYSRPILPAESPMILLTLIPT